MKSHKDKWQFLPLQETHPGNGTGCGCLSGSSPVGKVLVGRELDRRQPSTLAAREATSILGCMTRSTTRRSRERNSLEYSIQLSDPQFRNDIGKLGWV